MPFNFTTFAFLCNYLLNYYAAAAAARLWLLLAVVLAGCLLRLSRPAVCTPSDLLVDGGTTGLGGDRPWSDLLVDGGTAGHPPCHRRRRWHNLTAIRGQ